MPRCLDRMKAILFEKIVRKLRDGRIYSWRQKVFNLSLSKRRDIDVYSILNRGYSCKNMNNVCFAFNNALEYYKDADRFVVTVLMPEFFIDLARLTYN